MLLVQSSRLISGASALVRTTASIAESGLAAGQHAQGRPGHHHCVLEIVALLG